MATDGADPARDAGAAEIAGVLRGAQRIAIIGHVTPDADCLTSMAVSWLALRSLGKEALVVLPASTVSRRMNFLVRRCGLEGAPVEAARGADVALVLDTAKEPRVNVPGKMAALPGVPIANVDHHATNTRFGRWNWVEPHASSSSELVYQLVRALGCPVTPMMATLLYAGMHNDTQGFSLASAAPASLRVAAELAAAGAEIADVCEALERSRSRAEFELLKVVYANTRVSPDGRLAWSTATCDEIAAAGCTASDIDDQVEVVRSIEGVKVAILFTEGNAGKIRMNFRGEKDVPVLGLAQGFGGGGHTSSAGAILDGTIPQIVERVLPAAREFVARLPQSPG